MFLESFISLGLHPEHVSSRVPKHVRIVKLWELLHLRESVYLIFKKKKIICIGEKLFFFLTLTFYQMVNAKIRFIIIFAAKDGESLYSQHKQDRELTVAQIMNYLLPNSDLN